LSSGWAHIRIDIPLERRAPMAEILRAGRCPPGARFWNAASVLKRVRFSDRHWPWRFRVERACYGACLS
jgi:hypothetical protein